MTNQRLWRDMLVEDLIGSFLKEVDRFAGDSDPHPICVHVFDCLCLTFALHRR